MKKTILIVEDEGSLSGYLTKELQFEDFNVLVAADGLAAMETYQAHQNELLLILLDWMLPKLDVWKFFAAFANTIKYQSLL